jgi:hypothetical protein
MLLCSAEWGVLPCTPGLGEVRAANPASLVSEFGYSLDWPRRTWLGLGVVL